MSQNIFREKSLDKISSPEQLNEYIRVANPAVWIVLAAVGLLLVGALIWGVFGRLDTVLDAVADVRDGACTLYIEKDGAHKPVAGTRFTINGSEYTIDSVEALPISFQTALRFDALREAGLQTAQTVYVASARVGTENGVYGAAVLIDSVSPLSFIFNS